MGGARWRSVRSAWDSTLYARFNVNSEVGVVPSANAWGDDEDNEPMVRIAYRVL